MNNNEIRIKSFLSTVGIIAKTSQVDCFVVAVRGSDVVTEMFSDRIKILEIGIKTLFPDSLQEKQEVLKEIDIFAEQIAFHAVGFIDTLKAYSAFMKREEDEQQFRNPN